MRGVVRFAERLQVAVGGVLLGALQLTRMPAMVLMRWGSVRRVLSSPIARNCVLGELNTLVFYRWNR